MTGYQALREGAAWIDVSSRGKIRASGEDRARLLHAMTTNHIAQLTPGTGCYAYFLNDKGRILADVNVLCLEDSMLLDTEPETRRKVFEHLDRYIIADDVTLADETDVTASIAVEGPGAFEMLRRVGAPEPPIECHHAAWNGGGGLVARISLCGAGGCLLIVPVEEKAGVIAQLQAAGVAPTSAQDFEVVRLENGKPRYGRDLSERFLAQEANQASALHFNKGCYLGQEIVERVRSRGQVHRLLMPLEIEGGSVPEPGAKFSDGASAVAEITSAAFSPGQGKVVALAYVRSDKARPGTEIRVGETLLRVR